MKRYLFRYQISLPTCFYYCSTELQFLTVAGMLSRDALPMDIGAKYFDGNSWLLQRAPQVFGRKTHHIRQFEKVYGMRTIITIVKADYCLVSQLLLNILSNVTLPPYPSFFVHFKHTFVTQPTKISRFSITVTPPPRDTACHPPPKILNVHKGVSHFLSWEAELTQDGRGEPIPKDFSSLIFGKVPNTKLCILQF